MSDQDSAKWEKDFCGEDDEKAMVAVEQLWETHFSQLKERSGPARPGNDPADVLQETFIEVVKSRRGFDPQKGRWLAWATTVLVRTASRSRRRNPPSAGPCFEDDSGPEDGGTDPRKQVEADEIMKRLFDALTDAERFVVVSRMHSEKDAEIAKKLGWTRKRVYKTWHRAIEKLERLFKRLGLWWDFRLAPRQYRIEKCQPVQAKKRSTDG